MRFYTHHHQSYCGNNLHARVMYVCITDAEGEVGAFERIIAPSREDLAVICVRGSGSHSSSVMPCT